MIGDEGLHPVTKASRVQSFRDFIPDMFSPVLVEIHLYAGERKGDFDWALVRCAAAGQKTGSHWTQVAVFLGGGCADPLCRGFSAIGPSHRVDGRESRLEGYTADTQRIKVPIAQTGPTPIAKGEPGMGVRAELVTGVTRSLLVEWLSALDFNSVAP